MAHVVIECGKANGAIGFSYSGPNTEGKHYLTWQAAVKAANRNGHKVDFASLGALLASLGENG